MSSLILAVLSFPRVIPRRISPTHRPARPTPTARFPGAFSVVRVAVDFDLALEKSTSFYDTELQLTFRAEFFNIFIHTEFQNPTTGRVTSFLRRSVESFRDEPRFECNDRSLLARPSPIQRIQGQAGLRSPIGHAIYNLTAYSGEVKTSRGDRTDGH